MDEQALAEKLISYDSSQPGGIRDVASFVKEWLEAHEVPVAEHAVRDLPVLTASVGGGERCVVFHGHVDVVPAHPGQYVPRLKDDRLYGRGAYDMKGAVAAMMLAVADLGEQQDVRVLFALVGDEESDELNDRGSEFLVREGFVGDFVITGEPTDLHIGVQSKGVLALRLEVTGRAAHSSTPWLGDNAVLKAVDVFRQIQSMPFARESSELFQNPSINLARIAGGDAVNKVPDSCTVDIDIRYLPGQSTDAMLEEIAALPDVSVVSTFIRPPAYVERHEPHVEVLHAAVAELGHDVVSVGRDGISDAVCFIEAGIPAVEFGPVGGGHHGPEEWVSVSSLRRYRRALTDFVTLLGRGERGEARLRIA